MIWDRQSPSESPRFATRRKKEQQLARIGEPWTVTAALLAGIQALDHADYRSATSDFRNRTTHAFGPKFSVGYTRPVVREVVPAEEKVLRSDGGIEFVPSKDKLVVQYAFGGTPPLDLESARNLNLREFELARACFSCLVGLPTAAVTAKPAARGDEPT